MVELLEGDALETTVADFLRRSRRARRARRRPSTPLDDLPDDPQVAHNEVFVEREHPDAGPMREPRPAPRFSATPQEAGAPAPTSGEHSDEIVAELGFDAAALRAAGSSPDRPRAVATTSRAR